MAALTAAMTVGCTLGAAGTAAADQPGQYYGAIALSRLKNSAVVDAGLPSKTAADAAVIRDCANYDCEIVLHFTGGCAAVAQGADGQFGWATGGSKGDAEQAAVTSLGQSNPPFPDLGSAQAQPAHVVTSACSPDAQ